MMISPITACARKRNPIETFTVAAFWMTVVSDDRRLISSPVWFWSKKATSSDMSLS